MGSLTFVPAEKNFIAELAGGLLETAPEGRDLSGLTVVFPGRRPALYLRRELARRLGGAFFPPRCLAIDEFVDLLASAGNEFQPLGELEAAYMLFCAARRLGLDIPPAGSGFARFLPWGREIFALLDQLDLEAVPAGRMSVVRLNAALGYEVPETINRVLGDLAALRGEFERVMTGDRRFSRGLRYRLAAESCAGGPPAGFGTVFFGDFFYLHRTEAEVIGAFCRAGCGRFLFQAHPAQWPVMAESLRRLRLDPPDAEPGAPPSGQGPEVTLACGFDAHSQAALVREFIAGVPRGEREDLAVVLPEAVSLLPFLSEISGEMDDFNISLGYPLRRTSLYTLFRAVFAAQAGRRGERYHARSYLAVLRHPLVKNLALGPDPSRTRMLTHRVEECLLGAGGNRFNGRLFVSLDELESFPGIDTAGGERELLARVHDIFFREWESDRLGNFGELGRALERMVALLAEKSALARYPLNREFARGVLEITWELNAASFRDEPFRAPELFAVFMEKMSGETVNFRGSPLRGTQVLGPLETRGLSFSRVVFMDANESSLPRVRAQEPLLPREVMLALGLDRSGAEEEIQRYHFRRLVAGARQVHLVYSRDPRLEPSRFLEGLAWECQRASGSGEKPPVKAATFRLEKCPSPPAIPRFPELVGFLENFSYSPTSLDDYLACPCRFYYRHVLGLGESDELSDEPDGRAIGVFLHRFLAEFFRPFLGGRPAHDDEFRRRFNTALEKAFRRELSGRIRSGDFLVLAVLRHNLGRFLDQEAARPPAEIISLEEGFRERLAVGGRTVMFRCRADRIDRPAGGGLVVIDYKSGGPGEIPRIRPEALAGLSENAGRLEVRAAIRSFQLPLYAFFAQRRYRAADVRAAYCDLRSGRRTEFPDGSGLGAEAAAGCRAALAAVIREINDPGTPFACDEGSCRFCPYTVFCR